MCLYYNYIHHCWYFCGIHLYISVERLEIVYIVCQKWRIRGCWGSCAHDDTLWGRYFVDKKNWRCDHSFLSHCVSKTKSNILLFWFNFFFHIHSFSFGKSQTHDTPPIWWPWHLINSDDCPRCRYFDLALLWATSCWDYKTTSGQSKKHPHSIVYFRQPIYIFTSPMFFFYNDNRPKYFVGCF